MASTTTKALTKLVKINTPIKRVVSTSTSSRQGAQVLAVGADIAGTCPFRSTFETIDNMMSRPQQTAAIQVETPVIENKVQNYDAIPGPKGLPLIGTLFDYLKKDGLRFNKMFEAYRTRALEFGPIYKEKIATISTVIISDPDEYSKVIRDEGKYPMRREMEPMAYYRSKNGIGLGLVNAQGEEWHKYRTVVSKKMLKMKEVLDYCGSMDTVAEDFVQHLKDRSTTKHEVPVLEKEIFKWAMESIGTFLFEERIGCFGSPTPTQAQSFIDNLQGFFKLMQPLMYNIPLYKVMPTKMWKQYEAYADNVMKIGRSFVDKKAKALEGVVPKENEKVSFLTYLMSQESLTPDDALSTAVDLLVGATETTSNGSLWVMYCLAKNPTVQEKLFQEIQNVLPYKEAITPETLNKLPYIKAVIKETFRLYPITFATSRFVQKDIEVGGYNLPAGTHVQANLYGMFRDPEYFPDPEEFRPERWLREANMESNIKALSNLVWGHGARMCIGRRFAEQEMHIMLSKMVQNFKIEYHHEDIEPVLNTVMTPDRPLKLSFVPRESECL
ncbi:cytochrome P450 10-like isoform X2 [Mizuhopecten yessoensis]|uniref:Cytochrome P450 10 n=2 Tax=Mizuhopecten yessoensis TaxID=6573 RepID=A0A210R1U6_MIZYE|nr:cytochrome P450 10-like isoform X2 [Mizuhopecten yessoensis]OWF55008.1 Cytochrome P450 10 [Mizuhopecten yessoensis]